MARFRRKMATINTEKHILQFGPTTVAATTVNNLTLVNVADTPSVDTASQIRVGAVIKAVYIEVWIKSDDALTSSAIVALEKNIGSMPDATAAEIILMNTYPNRANFFLTHQGLLPQAVQSGIPFIREWVAIPKGKQRFGRGDKLTLNILALANGISFCGLAIFKENF